jgi:HK97 family phage portal protein
LPLHVYKQNGRNKDLTPDHPVYNLVHNEPNQMHTSFVWREVAQAQVDLWGNHYSRIIKDSTGRPVELIPFEKPSIVDPVFYKNKIYYVVMGEPTLNYLDVLHIPGFGFDGLKGKSAIAYAREGLGAALAVQEYGANFFGRGANVGGAFTTPQALSDTAYARLKKDIDMKYAGIANSHETMLLEEGLKFDKIGIPPEDSQFLQTKNHDVIEVCRWFDVPPHKVYNLERATFSNIEHQSIEFVTDTMLPLVTKWEQEFNRKLFREDEKGVYYTKFNLNGLLRSDSQARAEYLSKLVTAGIINRNEARAWDELNDFEGGERYLVPVNMVPADKMDEMLLQKQKSTEKRNENGE